MAYKKPNKFLWFMIVLIIFVAFAVFGFLFAKSQQSKSSDTSSPKFSVTKSPVVTNKTYANEVYGFSFDYPSTWEEKKNNISESNKELIFQVGFTDPVRLKEQEISLCLNSQSNNWTDAEHPQEKCASLIANLSISDKEKYSSLIYEHNIYVWVFKPATKSPLKSWLEKYYRAPGGEAASFEVGKEIEMAGLKGYAVDIACCADYNLAYVIQKGDYIYQIGTNYKDADNNGTNKLLDETAKTFKLLP